MDSSVLLYLQQDLERSDVLSLCIGGNVIPFPRAISSACGYFPSNPNSHP